jgi:AcrR family transcriptional regulator
MTHLSPTRAERKTATAERILVAAREEFGLKGFSRTTIRGIAVKAGVNSSLVHQYYGSKDLLFTEALGLGAGSHETAATHLGDVVAMKLGELSPETLALLRSMLTSTEAS